MTAEIDPYAILGLHPDATPREIEAAWRRAVHEAHPDRNPGDPNAGARLKTILAAGQILRDPEQRAAYDARRWPRHPEPPRKPTWTQLAWDGGGGGGRRFSLHGGHVVIVHKG